MADILTLLASAADKGGKVEPAALGADSYQWVAIAMVVLIGIFVWKKVPGMITGGLDAKIAQIKQQLDEAKTLRAEAEALRDEYVAKMADAEKHSVAMVENAKRDADEILAKAETDAELMVARRQRMAEDKIAAAERDAVEEVRTRAVEAAAAASRKLIAERHDSAADKALADEVIASL